MPPSHRAGARNVYLCDFKDPTTEFGGFCATAGMTNTTLHQIVEIIVTIRGMPGAPSRPLRPDDYYIQTKSGETVDRDGQAVQWGSYLIVSYGILEQNGEEAFTRANSTTTGTRVRDFQHALRERDRGCVVSKVENTLRFLDMWSGFEPAHIFPLAYEGHWHAGWYSDFITIMPSHGDAMNSVQNGLLLCRTLHTLFDTYIFSINPDDNFKVTFFFDLMNDLHGTCLEPTLINDPRVPHPHLLRWHFRQAVLTNARGVGEPVFEHDFPPGSDMMGDILSGPKAAERMEFELASRLAVHISPEDGGEVSRSGGLGG